MNLSAFQNDQKKRKRVNRIRPYKAHTWISPNWCRSLLTHRDDLNDVTAEFKGQQKPCQCAL